MKIEKFFGKRSNCENFPHSPKQIFGNRSRGNASLPLGDGRPCKQQAGVAPMFRYTRPTSIY